MGYLGWTIDQFWDSTPRELINAYRGKHQSEENAFRREHELHRIYTAILANVGGAKVKAKDLIEFPWEVVKVDKTKQLARLRKL